MISSCSSKTGRRKERSYALLVLKGKSCCAARSVAEVFKRSPYGNSPYRQHDVVEGRPSAALLSTVQLTDPEEAAEVCSREDSAMRLADERLSNSRARHTAIPVFCQGTDTRTSSSSLKVSIPPMAARAVVTLRICMLIHLHLQQQQQQQALLQLQQQQPGLLLQVQQALCVNSPAILHTCHTTPSLC